MTLKRYQKTHFIETKARHFIGLHRPGMSEHGVFCTFWLGNVLRASSRHNGVHLFDVATSKSGPNMVCLCILTWKCASRHNGVHLFDIAASKSGPNMVSFFHMLTSKCASRHNGVQLFISHLTTWLRTRRFSEPTIRPSGATNHWKNTVLGDFPTFSRTWIFFLLRLSLFWSSFFFPSLRWLFPSLLFICPYCRKFDF